MPERVSGQDKVEERNERNSRKPGHRLGGDALIESLSVIFLLFCLRQHQLMEHRATTRVAIRGGGHSTVCKGSGHHRADPPSHVPSCLWSGPGSGRRGHVRDREPPGTHEYRQFRGLHPSLWKAPARCVRPVHAGVRVVDLSKCPWATVRSQTVRQTS